MARAAESEWCNLSVGIWNGAETAGGGRLLYRVLVDEALRSGVAGATVWTGVEGGRATRAFRTVENEVASNELPIWMEIMDRWERVQAWLPEVARLLRGRGVLVWQPVVRGEARDRMHNGQDPAREHTPRPAGGPQAAAGAGATESHGSDVPPLTAAAPAGDELDQMARACGLPVLSGLEVRVYTVENAQRAGRPVYQAAADVLRQYQILWIATFRGVCGFGARRKLNRPRLFQPAAVPVMVTALDRADKVARALPALQDVLQGDGMLAITPVYLCTPR
ncbi:hypothetical protein GCM10010885_11540 [Alicyclobacillus cellulosilyticus]|uniref:PII-like signaling protein n=1 Tax=Alicyclobacillus cellulosilyticus TaxID=1003997 RepID=A0A917NK81_9BACL|nr:DUF190 domain-containing protein [Alicyclobacillus cellulosilyticus]GGJ03989.1 hypothetical protein GCM10010885_11540 [Alicyclobacillus cellulosilyticus]